ncbi:MAG TPA: hypothetical protein PLU71_02900 [Candidatus Dependentiae bacterium]|nr:hypothetical protein [Candidatus Dependentiae bacterium]HRQ62779.1 hypothetical protein [Candidatus Dependentiae bacterium]
MKHTKLILLTVIASICSTVQSNPRTMQSFAYYQQKTREFLTNLGVRNANAVKIEHLQGSNDLGHVIFINGSMKIRLNEQAFRNVSEEERLFTCAHEAAHYARNHPRSNRASLVIEQEADEYAARMLCANGYRWVVQEICNFAYQFVLYGQGHVQPGSGHPSYAAQYAYFSQILQATPTTTTTQNTPQQNRIQRAQNRTQTHPAQQGHTQSTYTTTSNSGGYSNAQPTHAADYKFRIKDFKEYLYPFGCGIAIYVVYHLYKNIVASQQHNETNKKTTSRQKFSPSW